MPADPLPSARGGPVGRAAPALVFGLALAAVLLFRLLLPAALQAEPYSDYRNFYEPVARSLLAGRGFTMPDGSLETTWGPGFPVVLAGVFAAAALSGVPESVALTLFSLLCMALSALAVYALGRLLWQPWLAAAAALLWVIYPFNLWFALNPYSELPFMLLLAGAVGLFWRGQQRRGAAWLAGCGALLGVAALIRPIGAGLPLLCAAVILIQRGQVEGVRARAGRAGALLLAFALVVAPWIIGVHQVSGQWIPISSTGFRNIVGGLSYATLAGFDAAGVPPDQLALQRELAAARPADLPGLLALLRGEAERRPEALGALLLTKLARSWYGTYSGRYEPGILLAQAPFVLLLLAGSGALWRARPAARPMIALHWLIVCYFWGMSTLAVSNLRYVAPALELVFIFAPGLLPASASIARVKYSNATR